MLRKNFAVKVYELTSHHTKGIVVTGIRVSIAEFTYYFAKVS